MISYEPFYQTLFRKNITEYHLIYKEGISANTLHRMRHGKAISTKTLDVLCFILACDVCDILCYKPDPDDGLERE
ncbi:MAG: helix-turn-helix domain-containing protein [Clostridia bacterium]|nr:helix-turn-helix domain-containing protein [Clostridia bacterium]